jgi:hypothetical protein
MKTPNECGNLVERVRLPDFPGGFKKGGRYNRQGQEDPNGSVFIIAVGPTAHVWAEFSRPWAPGEMGTMIFDNVAGDGILDTIVSQWLPGGDGMLGKNLNQPNVGEPVILFLARQRKPGAVKVVGRNASRSSTSVAAALLYIPGTGG